MPECPRSRRLARQYCSGSTCLRSGRKRVVTSVVPVSARLRKGSEARREVDNLKDACGAGEHKRMTEHRVHGGRDHERLGVVGHGPAGKDDAFGEAGELIEKSENV
jgi:hypothetical protein